MAKLDGGYLICVAGAAKLVGKKVNVRIARVLDGTAYAVLAMPRRRRPPHRSPPRPRPRSRRAPRARRSRARGGGSPEVVRGELVPRKRRGAVVAEKRKSTRRRERGSRGACLPRRRQSRRPLAAHAAGGGGRRSRPPSREQTQEGSVPDVTPEQEKPAEEAPPKKKTRRGSRGGPRPKKPAAATAAADTNGPGAPEAEKAEAAPTDDSRPGGRSAEHERPTSPGGAGAQADARGFPRREAPSQADDRGRRAAALRRTRTSLSAEILGPSHPIVPSCSTRRGAHAQHRRHAGAARALKLPVGTVSDEHALLRGEPRAARPSARRAGVGLHHPLVGPRRTGVEERAQTRCRPTTRTSRCSRC